MSRTSKKTTRADVVRWFFHGLREHRSSTPESGAHDHRLLDAYWAGHRFGFRLPWFVRRHFKVGPTR